ncbi:hypothetical protein EDD18DRAFT_1101933 [Armillaria luteobubalina]|uniref:Uncharacterized protein n=1 Tax=Armillaria luteobubalina TaxID=153913 RepID=A0AA39QDR6_9AGAR|nr:hypothetical protein EDD18DRAFT_1101933 [Armillaria luteobubalina]
MAFHLPQTRYERQSLVNSKKARLANFQDGRSAGSVISPESSLPRPCEDGNCQEGDTLTVNAPTSFKGCLPVRILVGTDRDPPSIMHIHVDNHFIILRCASLPWWSTNISKSVNVCVEVVVLESFAVMILFRRLIHGTVPWYSPGAWLLGTLANSVSAILNMTTLIPKENIIRRQLVSVVVTLHCLSFECYKAVECFEIPGWGPYYSQCFGRFLLDQTTEIRVQKGHFSLGMTMIMMMRSRETFQRIVLGA